MLQQLDALDHWRTLPIRQQPVWYDADAAAAVSAEIATLPPLVFAGEVDNLRDALAPRGIRSGLSAAGRRLRRDLRRRDGRADPQPHQDRAADGGRADVRRGDADREDGAHGGSVRQAAFERQRDPGRRDAARVPRRHRERLRLHGGIAPRRPRATAQGLPHGGVDDQSDPRIHPGRLRRSARGAQLEQGLRREPGEPGVRAARPRHRQGHQVHGGGGSRLRRAPPRGVLHRSRGSAHGLRAPDDPHRLTHRHALQHLRPLPLDRRAHQRPRRCTRGLLLQDPQPHRREARARRRRRTMR